MMLPQVPPSVVLLLPLDAIHPNPANPRRHSKLQIRKVAESIQAFGMVCPILIDAGNQIIAGHARWQACQLLAMAQIPAIRVEYLTDAQQKALTIADNRLAELATWDDALLGNMLRDLCAVDLDFSVEITGFAMAAIDLYVHGIEDGTAETIEDPEPGDVPVTQTGDLWRLSSHAVLCGNALEAADYEHLLGGEQAQMVFTDPPYNVEITGHVSGHGRVRHREFAMASGEMTRSEFLFFLLAAVKNLIACSIDGSIHYLCMDWRHISELMGAGGSYTELKNLVIWDKGSPGMGSLYRSQHELIFVYKNGRAPHINNVQLGKFGRSRSNIWSYAGANSFARTTDEGKLSDIHPTVKPVAMIADAMLDCSNRGGLVLDPFLGIGSTLIAAERMGRRCAGIELDPLYVDVAIRRWQRHTGQQAVHAVTGKTFGEIESQTTGASHG